jgi:hypothetical protein
MRPHYLFALHSSTASVVQIVQRSSLLLSGRLPVECVHVCENEREKSGASERERYPLEQLLCWFIFCLVCGQVKRHQTNTTWDGQILPQVCYFQFEAHKGSRNAIATFHHQLQLFRNNNLYLRPIMICLAKLIKRGSSL